jgi:sulfite dehydrogenase
VLLLAWGFCSLAGPVKIELPAETGSFKQAPGAELANGQCLICHSVEYVTTQPPMPRAFWAASVKKMQDKYGAAIPAEQVEPLLDYLTRHYGTGTNGAATVTHAAPAPAQPVPVTGPQLASKLGCSPGCHDPTIKIVGPPFREIAAKYQADAEALKKINEQIHKGGSGKWGPIIMPPFPQVTDAEAKVLANWILSHR